MKKKTALVLTLAMVFSLAPLSAYADMITVTNHSNTGVTAAFSYAADTDFTGITGTFDNASLNLESAVGTTVEAAPKATTSLSLNGALGSTTADNTKIGTITVKLN